MKKKGLLITTAVMGVACTMLIGNAVIVSGFLLNPDKSTESKTIVAAENVSYSKESAPALKFEPAAPVLTSNEYLAEIMTPDEIQMIYDFLDNSRSLAYDSTRAMTDSEVDRRMVLEDMYLYEGLRPENPLPLTVGNYDVYFDMEKEVYHYPERTLADEELLQIIDWRTRVNYALTLRNTYPKPSSKDITEDEAIAAAIKSIKKLFDADATALEIKSSFHDSLPTQGSYWSILVSPYKMNTLLANGETFWNYVVLVDSLSGDVIDTTRACPTRERTKINGDDVTSILNDSSWLDAAMSVVVDKQLETRSIKDTFINTEDSPLIIDGKTHSDGFNPERGIVDSTVILEDGATYMVSMYYPDKSLRCLIYSNGK